MVTVTQAGINYTLITIAAWGAWGSLSCSPHSLPGQGLFGGPGAASPRPGVSPPGGVGAAGRGCASVAMETVAGG